MKSGLKLTLLSCLLIVLLQPFSLVCADHDHEKEARHHGERERRHHREGDDHHDAGERLEPVTNETYRDACGACHLAYQPELLPSESWRNLLARLDDHFGETMELDTDTRSIIAEYLETNAAERSSSKFAAKIVKSLGGGIPDRITEIAYIQRKHHEISDAILKRASIGSLSNCGACHKTAAEGNYDDDSVHIPD